MNNELLNTIIKILIILESSGDPAAVGDKSAGIYRAVGVLQIHKIMVNDVNRILGKKVYSYEDRSDPARSVEICRTYLRHYTRPLKAKGLPDVFYVQYAARAWCGGPDGPTQDCTKSYGRKAKAIFHIIQMLERIEKLGIFEK